MKAFADQKINAAKTMTFDFESAGTNARKGEKASYQYVLANFLLCELTIYLRVPIFNNSEKEAF